MPSRRSGNKNIKLKMRKQKIIILGSTGSIGKQTLEVLGAHPDMYSIVGLAAKDEISELKSQINKFRPKAVALGKELEKDEAFLGVLAPAPKIYSGRNCLEKLVKYSGADSVVVAVPGTAALEATFEAIRQGKKIFLATKEILVTAGPLINKALKKYNTHIIPLDSEHSAVFQCLLGEDKNKTKRIILTCSGGPFRNWAKEDFKNIKKEQVLSHPVWKMGPKITIDSATLMNKGFEVLEAHYLFEIPLEKIEVLIHPECIVHSMIEFVDGTTKAVLSNPDMKFPIQYALFYPDRLSSPWQSLNLMNLKSLTFQNPDTKNFPCLNYAYLAGKIGGTMPAILNFADEIAVEMFLENKINFLDIPKIIKRILKRHRPIFNPTLKEILKLKDWVKNQFR